MRIVNDGYPVPPCLFAVDVTEHQGFHDSQLTLGGTMKSDIYNKDLDNIRIKTQKVANN